MICIGLLAEGTIDENLLPPLIEKIFEGREVRFRHLPYPPNGAGEIPKNLKILTRLYQYEEEKRRIGCDLFILVHDSRNTQEIQKEIRSILRDAVGFPAVYGLAIQEIEAWVLAEHKHLNNHLFQIHPCPTLPHKPEDDPAPKKTLIELFLKRSERFEYDHWNTECAWAVAPYLRPKAIAFQCRRGFGAFLSDLKRQAL